MTDGGKHVSDVHDKEACMAPDWQVRTQISLWCTPISGVSLLEIDQLRIVLIQLFRTAHSF